MSDWLWSNSVSSLSSISIHISPFQSVSECAAIKFTYHYESMSISVLTITSQWISDELFKFLNFLYHANCFIFIHSLSNSLGDSPSVHISVHSLQWSACILNGFFFIFFLFWVLNYIENGEERSLGKQSVFWVPHLHFRTLSQLVSGSGPSLSSICSDPLGHLGLGLFPYNDRGVWLQGLRFNSWVREWSVPPSGCICPCIINKWYNIWYHIISYFVFFKRPFGCGLYHHMFCILNDFCIQSF